MQEYPLTNNLYFGFAFRGTRNMDSLSRQLLLLVHLLVLEVLVCTRTVGVTHWKLQENSIVPASAASERLGRAAASASDDSDEVFWSSISGEDPEFAVLVKRTTGGGGGAGAPSAGLGTSAGGATMTSGAAGARGCASRKSCSRDQGTHKNNNCPQRAGAASDSNPPVVSVGQCSEKPKSPTPRNPDGSGPMSVQAMREAQPMILSCGEPVESTVYDFLEGIARRDEHPSYPEPEVAMIFKRSESDTSVDLFEVEMALRRAYQENPESLTVLNQIGNFWRIKGNTQLAIECFRTALYLSPDHPDLLLNLARVLFNLQYLDDAVFLAKRSLHMKSSESHAWLQYFTLGEVYKAQEKYEEAAFYFLKSLELNPGLQVAEMHLRELGLEEQHSVNIYTLIIILALIAIVLVVMYYLIVAVSGGGSAAKGGKKTQNG